MPCVACGRGFHSECESTCSSCHPEPDPIILSGRKVGRPEKSDEDITDTKSTGRKRAARDYPIERDQPCEWRGFKDCGGGLKPIIGCIDGKQVQRHHGPIKDPRNNRTENVHRICVKCHRRWHVLNDPVYDERTYADLPHRPLEAQPAELVQNDINWRRGAGVPAKYTD